MFTREELMHPNCLQTRLNIFHTDAAFLQVYLLLLLLSL